MTEQNFPGVAFDRWLTHKPAAEAYDPKCGGCGQLLEDCENGLGCLRCAVCRNKSGECFPDCGEGHLIACEFPMDMCSCTQNTGRKS